MKINWKTIVKVITTVIEVVLIMMPLNGPKEKKEGIN